MRYLTEEHGVIGMGILKRMKDMSEMVNAAPGMVAQAQQMGAQAQQLGAQYQEMAAAQQAARQAQMGGGQNGGFPADGFQNGGFQAGGFPNSGFTNSGFQNGGLQNGGFQAGADQAGPDFEPIAGVPLDQFAAVSKAVAAFNYDPARLPEIAASRGIPAYNWETAAQGWNDRIKQNPAVARRFNQLYREN
jgi:hypothetical protein